MKKSLLLLFGICTFVCGCTDNGLLLRSNGKDYVAKDLNGVYKIGEPYQVSNIWYRPEENYDYKEVGIASWYGPDFHQGVTANGETYNMHALSAAHRTLPLPSIVKVTNLDNGKFVVVRVNDRGPFVNNRIIDLSKAAAEKLDFIDSGTAKVRVEILEKESKALKREILANGGKVVGGAPILETQEEIQSNEPVVLVPQQVVSEEVVPAEQAVIVADEPIYSPTKKRLQKVQEIALEKGYYIQAGAFSQKENAILVQQRLNEYGNVIIQDINHPNGVLHRVRIGPFENGEDAAALKQMIEQNGYTDMRLIQEK